MHSVSGYEIYGQRQTHLHQHPPPSRIPRVSRMTMSTEKISLDIHKILTLLPHCYPILLVDRVLDLEPHRSIKALKNVSFNEPYFMGHFPNRPVMPGVLILEALAQTAALLAFSEEPHESAKLLIHYCIIVLKGVPSKQRAQWYL